MLVNGFFHFLPAHRFDSAVLAVSRCLSASITSRYCIETDGRIKLGFGRATSFHLSRLNRKFWYPPALCSKLWSRKFCHNTSIVAIYCQQSSWTVELCWPHLRRCWHRGSVVDAIYSLRVWFATRPSIDNTEHRTRDLFAIAKYFVV